MSFDVLKKVYEKTPNKIKFALQPLFVRVLTENPIFKRTYQELEEFDKLDKVRQKEKQFYKLKETLIYASQHVPYYNDLFKKVDFNPTEMSRIQEIEKLPILEKNVAVSVGEALYSDEDIEYYTSYTGGSSGKALKCILDKDSYYKERAFFSYFLAPLGYNPKKSRTVSFYGHNKGKEYYFSPIKADITISPFRLFDEKNFESIYKLILEFHPDFITCYASAIVFFAKLCRKYHKELQLKGIVFTSENWSEEDRNYVEETFHCRAVSCYGHTERAVFGSIYKNNCVFHPLYGYTELVPTDEEDEYQVVCTGFLCKKLPLIRYLTDDTVKVDEDGNFKLIGHRKSDIHLIGKNGVEIFKGAMTLHIAETQKVSAYQYVQKEAGKAELHIVETEKLSQAEINRIENYIHVRCENMLDIRVKIVPEIKWTARGKYIWAISEIV